MLPKTGLRPTWIWGITSAIPRSPWSQEHNFTSGRIYHNVITKERRGDYLGGTVQVIPHITDEIKQAIMAVAPSADVAIIEIGGTVGDIESLPFMEAIRQLKGDLGKENVCYIHLTLVPFIKSAGEVKTKPTQHSVKELRSIGIQPDILLCRTEKVLSPDIKAKIALFCNVEPAGGHHRPGRGQYLRDSAVVSPGGIG